MSFKKILLFILMLPLLVSCGTDSIAGVYVFQMGKEAGTHFNVTLNLKNDEYKTESFTEPGFKKFDFSVNIKMGTEEIEEGSITEILSYFADENGTALVPGYYKATDKTDAKGEQILKIGIEFSYIINKAKEIYKKQTGEDLPDDISDGADSLNDSDLIQSLLYTSYKDNTVNFYIPVSGADAILQLYWYGVDVQMYYEDPTDITSFKMGIEKSIDHDYGTTPTTEDVAEINKTFPQKHNALLGIFQLQDNLYRPFHQVKLGLTKKQ